ncbi:hypothetical protein [Streptomyces sp. NBC_00162]|uniref:hypothetical protein n=1 Tax=Streptomyces sp. NBC_00162 TaxID=2903629 RepID=UPI00214C0A26|nr:hypothetical protein [Streptomyces sp. NBC_00162]UUU44305.1 hypothetical protein JIW86_39545 [Streptomyces sp. NBC_00162]
MVTARAAFGATRTRRPAGPLRLLWLAALLFAFLYTHAAGADSASAHVTGGAVTVPHEVPAESNGAHTHGAHNHGAHTHEGRKPGGRDDDSGHTHPAEACASGHPQHGIDLPGTHLLSLGERTPASAAMTPQPWTRTLPCGLPPLRSSLSSVVQQV